MTTQTHDVIKNQTEHIFNICEKPTMNFICDFLEETPNILYKDNIPTFSEPLIIKPINELNNNMFPIFQLKSFTNINEYNNNKKDNIDNIIQFKEIKEAIGFLFYAVKNVYGSIISETLINNKPMLNNSLELNDKNWTFYPKYTNKNILKINFLKQSLFNITELKKNNSNNKSILDNLDNEYNEIISTLSTLEENKELLEAMMQKDIEINEKYNNKPVIGIILNLVNSNDLNSFLSTI